MASNDKKNKLAIRIIAWILCVMMILGTIMIIAEVLHVHTHAAEVTSAYDDINVRVGLIWGSSSVAVYPTTTLYGYHIGIQKLDDDARSFTKLFSSNSKALCVTTDANLVADESAGGYQVATSKVTVGGYHIELGSTYQSFQEVQQVITQSAASLSSLNFANGCYAFPVYRNGSYRIRVYDFSSDETAANKIGAVQKVFPSESLSVVAPDQKYLSVVDTQTNRIVLEFMANDVDTTLGLVACDNPQTASEPVYIGANSLIYQDVLSFRKTEGSGGKFSVINVIKLEDYVEGVLPYEISPSWPLEVQKTFAVVARTYIMGNLGKREAYGFDLYNTSQDQVYKGAGLVNDVIRQAVKETRGLVLSYEGKLTKIYYYNCSGTTRVSAGDAWGGETPVYLKAIPTPWENYTAEDCKNGFWIREISASELAKSLKATDAGSKLTGNKITSVEVVEYGENSTYVKTIKVTDNNGKTATITTCSDVREAFGLPSANFVIGKGSVAYTKETVSANPVGSGESWQTKLIRTLTETKLFSVLTAVGVFQPMTTSGVTVLTSTGYEKVNSSAYILSAEQENVGPKYTVASENLTAKASDSSSFIIVGKGYGHGVGISQYGAYCLAEYGYDSDYILNAYFAGAETVDFRSVK